MSKDTKDAKDSDVGRNRHSARARVQDEAPTAGRKSSTENMQPVSRQQPDGSNGIYASPGDQWGQQRVGDGGASAQTQTSSSTRAPAAHEPSPSDIKVDMKTLEFDTVAGRPTLARAVEITNFTGVTSAGCHVSRPMARALQRSR